MTLEQLRIFLAVAEHLHFTRAAESLFLTQPAVSAAIQSLEEGYGVKLFHRIGRRVEIAEAGRLLKIEAQKILEQVALAERGLRELNNLQRGELKLGSSLTIGNYWLPDKINRFKQQYPGITVNCILGNAEEICEGTATGLFDLGLVTGGVKPELRDALDQEMIGVERLKIVVGRSHAWFGKPQIQAQELIHTHWIMREPGSGAQRMLEQALHSWGIQPNQLEVMLVLSSSEMVKSIVEGGSGAAALPELMVQKELQLGTLHAINILDDHNPHQSLEIVQPVLKLKHRQRFQTRLATTFEQLLSLSLLHCDPIQAQRSEF
ncbi:MAG: LysR substrate-binding domain-containing protein [Leptolyngbyaceae cyanobacterium bins.59]|nr:LysR substrate-binding domain-containing protein [Leptolyngbyaceae cyanobacterium bins.59]